MNDIKGKVFVITGGSSGIGKALAEAALRNGAFVAVCARNKEKLEGIFLRNEKVLVFQADVSKEQDCHAFIDQTILKFGKIDILINNAGLSMRALFEDTELKVLHELMDVNFWGAVYCTKHALPSIKSAKGVILGISSIAGYRGLPARTGYSASKFALQGFLESLRTELLYSGTHVMWASPGFISTNIRNVARDALGRVQKETPLDEKKLMSAEECAEIILDGIIRRKRTIVMTRQGKLTVWLNKLLPGLADKLVYRHFLKEPGSPLRN
jgi:short-subunit dehydrogenase